jgi:ABC-type multidrug transport system ATPase subunit
MRFKNITIKDFRNISRANVSFGKINVLTGRNSSGKSNFLLAIAHALSRSRDYSNIFSSNVVSLGQGKDSSTITSTLMNIPLRISRVGDDEFISIKPTEYIFEKIIGKSSLSKKHSLKFIGKYYYSKDQVVKLENVLNGGIIHSDKIPHKNITEVVYEQEFDNDQKEDVEPAERSSFRENQDKFLYQFDQLQDSVVFWTQDPDAIYKYVTAKSDEPATYEQLTMRLRQSVDQPRFVSFNESKFVLLLADLQKSDRFDKYNADLKLFTQGIVFNMNVITKGASKGRIIVESPNGPKDVWTISYGTAILVFFVTLMHWLDLPSNQRSYKTPSVMIVDEVDSKIHPALMREFIEVLRIVSNKVQLFLSSHSPYFVDLFEKNELFFLKDSSSMRGQTPTALNRCNIYDYDSIIKKLPQEKQKIFLDKNPSELFVDGLIEGLFPQETSA